MLDRSNSIRWHPITRDLLIAQAEYLARLDESTNVVALRHAAQQLRSLQEQRAVLVRKLIVE